MDFFNRFPPTSIRIIKGFLVLVAFILALTIVVSLIGSFSRSMAPQLAGVGGGFAVAPSAPDVHWEEAAYSTGYDGALLSVRNAISSIAAPPVPWSVGDDADEFEVTEYGARFEKRDSSDVCARIEELKSRDDVIFENANRHGRSCDHTFKVRRDSVPDVLGYLEDLGPEELSENTYTIKNQIDDFTAETEILREKLASINATMESALSAYDDITLLATRSQNADALAKIIDSRVQLIERLTTERINVAQQLDRYERAKAQELDRLDYTYFHTSVVEVRYIDGDRLEDSWRTALREMIQDVSTALQALTLGLVTAIFIALQILVYLGLATIVFVVVAKFAWRWIRTFWQS